MTPEDVRKHHIKKLTNDPVGFTQEYLLPIKKRSREIIRFDTMNSIDNLFSLPLKIRGRSKMKEKFFYDPYEKHATLIGVDVANGIEVGNIIVGSREEIRTYITTINNKFGNEFNWQITYEYI